jgi:hypothetical protein
MHAQCEKLDSAQNIIAHKAEVDFREKKEQSCVVTVSHFPASFVHIITAYLKEVLLSFSSRSASAI